ncbi:hypothetical protein [Kallotenue papyrolyticum]|uniref:hypothetical protein n=1 Tax=Kallotenue papyrolyticum TaxID=1325125 RepID=UPI0004785D3A|nr:hypothetical protein [Kallotenue papyrolyticum]
MSQSAPDQTPQRERSASMPAALVPLQRRRAIQIAPGQDVVIQPRLPTEYKLLIWSSFVLNLVLLLVVLIGGTWGLSRLRAAEAALNAAIDWQSPAGQRLQQLRRDPAQAVAALRWGVGELHSAVNGMHAAHIRTTIPIDQRIPVRLTVPVNQQTTVLTTAPVPLVAPATFTLPGGGGQINGQVALNLPPGLELPVDLSLTIPISESLPVQFDVPVDIPIARTEMGDDLERLQRLVAPAAELLDTP